MKRRFVVELSAEAVIDIDEAIINSVDDEWRKQLYKDVKTPEDIAEYIAYNIFVNNLKLSHIEGFADQPDENIEIQLTPIFEAHCLEEIKAE
jgi:hypothetical protein